MQAIEPPPNPPGSGPVFRAAQYVRMSTEHQQYLTEDQSDKIREYAARRNIEIVRTYADEGKSGLRIAGRQALQQLIKDVESDNADFQLFPAEQQRIVRLLIERVIVSPNDLEVRFRPNGIEVLALELQPEVA